MSIKPFEILDNYIVTNYSIIDKNPQYVYKVNAFYQLRQDLPMINIFYHNEQIGYINQQGEMIILPESKPSRSKVISPMRKQNVILSLQEKIKQSNNPNEEDNLV